MLPTTSGCQEERALFVSVLAAAAAPNCPGADALITILPRPGPEPGVAVLPPSSIPMLAEKPFAHLPRVRDQIDAVGCGAATVGRRRHVAIVTRAEEIEVGHSVADCETRELDEGAQDARGARRAGIARLLLRYDRCVSAQHTVVGLSSPVGRQIYTGAIAIELVSERVKRALAFEK